MAQTAEVGEVRSPGFIDARRSVVLCVLKKFFEVWTIVLPLTIEEVKVA